jgi:hypothetical protein
MTSAAMPLRKGPSGPKAPPPSGDGPRLFYFDIAGGPIVGPNSLGAFQVQTDSFSFDDVGEWFWTASVPDQTEVGGSTQFITSVHLSPGTNPGATCTVYMAPANIDPVVAATTGPFRLVLALYPKPATAATVVPP